VEEEGSDALEVGPQAYAAEDAQDGAEEGIEHLAISDAAARFGGKL